MANSPSKKTHRQKPTEGLNLTPFIDMITCLMFFLMMFAGIIPVVIIDAPLPKVASTAEEVKKAKEDEKRFEVTVTIDDRGFGVKATGQGDRKIPKLGTGEYAYAELRTYLMQLKARKADAKELTLLPTDDITYDVMVQVMDLSREFRPGDPGYQAVPAEIASKPEAQQFNRLFSDVSIGGI